MQQFWGFGDQSRKKQSEKVFVHCANEFGGSSSTHATRSECRFKLRQENVRKVLEVKFQIQKRNTLKFCFVANLFLWTPPKAVLTISSIDMKAGLWVLRDKPMGKPAFSTCAQCQAWNMGIMPSSPAGLTLLVTTIRDLAGALCEDHRLKKGNQMHHEMLSWTLQSF